MIVAPTSRSARSASFRTDKTVDGNRTRVLVDQLGAVDAQRLGDQVANVSAYELWSIELQCQDGKMSLTGLERCTFVTERLQVGPWHDVDYLGGDLSGVVASMLTERSTTALPEAWRGDYSVERANAWIKERDEESPTLLATERASGCAVALVIVHEIALDDSAADVRIGYVIAESAWSRGLATELVGGLVDWARALPSIQTLTGGVDAVNQASVRVLVKNGFELISVSDDGEATYQLRFDAGH